MSFGASPPKLNDPVEGQKLAAELRSTTPTADAHFKGVLRISKPGNPAREVPFTSSVGVGQKAWDTTYLARPTDAPRENLSIGRPNDGSTNYYSWQRGENSGRVEGDTATNSFAGSDFALLDLGLEFFQWPTQILVTREMRKGRGCDVLESRPARTNLYSRVVSWIDLESRAQGAPGLLMAEAYDRSGKLLKEFEISDFTKVNGQWQVSGMELRNRQTKTRTRLQFDFDKH